MVTFYTKGKRYGIVTITFVSAESPIMYSPVPVKTVKWCLLPTYLGTHAARIRIVRIAVEMKEK